MNSIDYEGKYNYYGIQAKYMNNTKARTNNAIVETTTIAQPVSSGVDICFVRRSSRVVTTASVKAVKDMAICGKGLET